MAANPGLWDFAVSTYSRPGVKDACRALQDHRAVDVTLLLFSLWLAYLRCQPADMVETVKAGLNLTEKWSREVVQPLRSCRRALKRYLADDSVPRAESSRLQTLREDIKASELEAERMQLLMLEALVPDSAKVVSPMTIPSEAARALECYFSISKIDLDHESQVYVAQILEGLSGDDSSHLPGTGDAY